MDKNERKLLIILFAISLPTFLLVIVELIENPVPFQIVLLGISFFIVYQVLFVWLNKITGTLIGVLTILAIVYLFFVKTSSLINLLSTTRLVSVIGLWLTGAGFVGGTLLQKWENKLAPSLDNTSSESISTRMKDFSSQIDDILVRINLFTKIMVFITLPGLAISVASNDFWVKIFGLFPFLFCISVFLYYFFSPVAAHIIYLPVLILLIPYKIASFMDSQKKVERALLLLGLMLGTIGLVFDV